MRPMSRPSRYIHDDWLGHVPRPNHVEPGLSIDATGLRATGTGPSNVLPSRAILAVGDSFTFGEEVTDTETWPSKLQARMGRRVLNGGVSGYGLDQIVIRAEKLTGIHKPEAVVVSFIAEDIERTEMRRLWWRNKPWFTVIGNDLKIAGVPVPPPSPLLGTVRSIELPLRKLPPIALHWLGYHVRTHPRGTGELIAPMLVDRLAVLQRTSGAPVILIAEYDAHVWRSSAVATRQRKMTERVLGHAAKCGISVLDSFSLLSSTQSPARLYQSWHMNERGNAMIASLVATALRP